MTILELIPTEPQYLKKTVSRSDKILGCFQGWNGCPVDGDCIVMTMRRGQLWPCPLTIPSNMVSRLCTNLAIYIDSKLAPDFIHWYPETKTVIGTLKQKPLAVASFLSHTQLPEMSFYFFTMVIILSFMSKICGHSAVTRCLQLAPYSDLARLPHMVYFRIQLVLNVWSVLLFRCWVPTYRTHFYLYDFSTYGVLAHICSLSSRYFNVLQSTLQHWWYWWLAGYSQEHPGVALSTGYGHICSQPQLGNEGVPGVSYGDGTGLNTKLRGTSPVFDEIRSNSVAGGKFQHCSG